MLTRKSSEGDIQCIELCIPSKDFTMLLPAYKIEATSIDELRRKIGEDVESVKKASIEDGGDGIVQVLVLSESNELNSFSRTICIYALGDLSKWK